MTTTNPPFDQRQYHRFSNAIHTGVTLSTGFKHQSPQLVFTPSGSRSSENWQLFPQNGRYFIRNYDYGADVQLGLVDATSTVPQLLPRSGDLGQQWMLIDDNGNWRLINGLTWNADMLAVSNGHPPAASGGVYPEMKATRDGSEAWSVSVNLSAGGVRWDMLVDVPDVQVRLFWSTDFCLMDNNSFFLFFSFL